MPVRYLKNTKSVELSDLEKKKKKKKKSSAKGTSKSSKTKEKKDCIPYKSDDYLIIKIGAKYELGTSIGRNKLLLEKGVENDETSKTVPFEDSEVCANFGQSVPVGQTVFGIKLNPYEFTLSNKNWGDIHFYRKLDGKHDTKGFDRMLTTCWAKLHEIKATGFAPLTMKIFAPKGKKVGMYKRAKKGDELHLMPPDFKDREFCAYLLMHEAAHGVWFTQVPQDIQVLWIDSYHSRIKIHKADKKKLKRLAKDAANCAEGIGSFIKNECDGEDVEIMKECVAYVKRVHKITQRQLELYIQQNGTDSILKFWPKSTDIGKPVPDITEYAMESYEEFFAEAFAFYMTGKKLPKDVKKLLKKTFKNLTKNYD